MHHLVLRNGLTAICAQLGPLVRAMNTSHRSRARGFVALTLAVLSPPPSWSQDPAADRLWREAQRQESSDRYGALDAYHLLVDQFPNDTLAPQALLRMVQMRREDRDPQRTFLALDQLIDRYGRSPEAATGYLIRGDILTGIAQSTTDLDAARAAFRRVPLLFGREGFPDLPARSEALYRSGVLGRQLDDDKGAAADFLSVIEDQAKGPFTNPARLAFGRLLLDQGDWIAATEVLQRVINGAATRNAGPEQRAAMRWLSLLHRRTLRPLAGQRLVQRAQVFAPKFALANATGVAAHEDGRVLVTDPGQQVMAVLDSRGQVQVRATIRGLSTPYWDGDQATATADNTLVQPFGGQSTSLSAPDRDTPLKGMSAIALGPFDQRFVLAKGQPGVLRYQGRRHAGSLLAASRQDLTDLATDGSGRVYVLDKKAREVRRIEANGTSTTTIVRGTWKRAEALAVDSLGYLFVADRALGEIHMYDPAGNRTTTLGPLLDNGTQLRAPIDLAVDGEGRLFVLDARLPNLLVFE